MLIQAPAIKIGCRKKDVYVNSFLPSLQETDRELSMPDQEDKGMDSYLGNHPG